MATKSPSHSHFPPPSPFPSSPAFSFTPWPVSPPSTRTPGLFWHPFVLYTFTTSLSTWIISHFLARRGTVFLFGLVILSFALASLGLAVRNLLHGDKVESLVGFGALDKKDKVEAGLTGAALVACAMLRMVEAERNHALVWTGLEFYAIPVFALFTSFLPTIDLPPVPHIDTLASSLLASFIAFQIAFLAFFVDLSGVTLTILRTISEGYLWYLLRNRSSETSVNLPIEEPLTPPSDAEKRNRQYHFLSSVCALLLSCGVFILLHITNLHLPQTLQSSPSHGRLFILCALCLSTSTISLFHLSPFFTSSTTTPTTSLLVQNLVVLSLGGWFGQGGQMYNTIKLSLSGTYAFSLLVLSTSFSSSLTSPISRLQTLSEHYFTKHPRRIFILTVLPLFFLLLFNTLPTCTHTSLYPFCLPPSRSSLDIVIAHYDKPLPILSSHISYILSTPHARSSTIRIFLYEKGGTNHSHLWDQLPLQKGRDFIMDLGNLGREGETYLTHITRLYDLPSFIPNSITHSGYSTTPSYGIASQTYFLQSHLAWEKIAVPRISAVDHRTTFISLGPYMRNKCGLDGRGTGEYELMQEVWKVFKGRTCGEEDGEKLSCWAGQFLVGRERVMGNQKDGYEEVLRLLRAPEGDPIHNHWAPIVKESPSEPAFGHAVERSWPLIFGCDDPEIADKCEDETWKIEDCQCREV